MRMRRLEDELKPVRRAPRPNSSWRIITPFLLLTLFIPSFVLAYACTTDQGPWTANGYFGPGRPTETLLLLSPLIVWAASWLWSWEGDYDILEPRAAVGVIADAIGLLICANFALDLFMTEWAYSAG